MGDQVCHDADFIGERMARLAAIRMRCCFSKSNLSNAASAEYGRCWCYSRDDNGNDVTLQCVSRVLVIDPGKVGDARYSYRDA